MFIQAMGLTLKIKKTQTCWAYGPVIEIEAIVGIVSYGPWELGHISLRPSGMDARE